MTDKALKISEKKKPLSFAAKIKAQINWYIRAKTIYDLHSPSAYSLGQLFLKLKKGDKTNNLQQLEAFQGGNTVVFYLAKKEFVEFLQNYDARDLDRNMLIYSEDFRSFVDPEDLLKKFHPQKTVLIEGANQLMVHIKAEKGEPVCIPLIAYKWKFWRAGFF